MTKRIYAVADEVPKGMRGFLTPGTRYPVETEYNDVGFTLIDNEGGLRGLSWKASRTLGGRDWRRVEVDEGEALIPDPVDETQAAHNELDAIRDVIPVRYILVPPDGGAVTTLEAVQDMARDISEIHEAIPARYLHPTKLQAPLSTLDAVRRMVEELERRPAENEALRDEFAKAAMEGMLAHHGSYGPGNGPGETTARAYEHADAMLEARRRK